MFAIGAGLKLLTVFSAAGWLAWIGFRRDFSRLNIIWAVFCAGLVSILLIELMGQSAFGAAYPVMAIASCASCSFFWLTSRALFRHDPAINWPEITIVAGIFLPTVFDQIAIATNFGAVIGDATLADWMARLDNMQVLFSSTALVLAFGEGLNGWSGISESERPVRYVFLSSFGAGVVICVLLFDHGRLTLVSADLTILIQGICAAAIMASMSLAVVFRWKNPLPDGSARKVPPASQDEQALASQITTLVADGAYLDPDLKVTTLARRLHEKDYKISRAIVAALGQPNFNRFINQYRIKHAKGLLTDLSVKKRGILEIAMDSGFASLGPFNRAFKDATGLTPREYRQQNAINDGALSSTTVFAE
ncbi:MAG: AraC family transcriptional regulator [Hyphobacterium sp.]|nr:MAG: AraC family transcriptional regulator [Hyphobacterium sp.]